MKIALDRRPTVEKFEMIKLNDENILNKRKESLQVIITYLEKFRKGRENEFYLQVRK
jgi:hypothetical protein